MQKRVLWGIALLCCNLFPQYIYESNQSLVDLTNQTDVTWLTTGDDGISAAFNLGFDFTFYDQTFSTARMASNGCLHFGSTGTGCNQYNPTPLPKFNYTIYPFWTDLIAADANAKMAAKNFNDKIVFGWYKMQEYYRTNSYNSFEVILWNNNSFDIRYGDLDVINHDVLIGQQGTSNETYTYYFHDECNTGSYNGTNCYSYDWNSSDKNANLEAGGSLYYEAVDCSNPLNDTSCTGYEEAYLSQQCDIDALYSTSCTGYAQAYQDQQCGLDSLYSTECSGYEEAYLDQQCGIDALYDSSCTGYAEAYLDQQCTIDTLYDTSCPGYEQAYRDYECELDSQAYPTCSGYIPEVIAIMAIQTSPMEYEVFEITEEEVIPYTEPVEEVFFEESIQEELYEPPVEVVETYDPLPEIIDVIDVFDAEELVEAFVLEETMEEIETIIEEEPIIEEEIVEEIVEEAIEESIEEVVEKEVVQEEVKGNSISKGLAVIAQAMSVATDSYTTQNNIGNTETQQTTSSQSSNSFGSSTSNSPSISDQILSASAQTNTVLQMTDNTETLGGNSITITPLFTLDDTVMADVQINDIQDQILSATTNVMTASEADKIADKIIAQNLKQEQEEMEEEQQESGEYADQTAFVAYLGFVPGFNQYRDTSIPDQQQWYQDKTIYTDNKIDDNTNAYYNLSGANISTLQKIIDLQVNL